MLALFCRAFAVKAKIERSGAGENCHFAVTGKLFDRRLTIRQMIALRLAADDIC
jgi:hypothetical protein